MGRRVAQGIEGDVLMITALITIGWILAYLLPAGLVIRTSHDKLYKFYFDKQIRLNESRSKENPSNSEYSEDHANYPTLYANRRKWCASGNYKMPADWIIADYKQGGSIFWSPKIGNSVISVSLGLLWPLSLSLMIVIFVCEHTVGRLLEPPTLQKQEKQLDRSVELANKAKETLELANTFKNEDPSTYTLLHDTAAMMAEQAIEMRKLNS